MRQSRCLKTVTGILNGDIKTGQGRFTVYIVRLKLNSEVYEFKQDIPSPRNLSLAMFFVLLEVLSYFLVRLSRGIQINNKIYMSCDAG